MLLFSSSVLIPEELYLIVMKSRLELVPVDEPPTYTLPLPSIATEYPASKSFPVPLYLLTHCCVPEELYFTVATSHVKLLPMLCPVTYTFPEPSTCNAFP